MKEVAIFGMGNMGTAIQERLESRFRVKGFRRGDDLGEAADADVAILAVKPDKFEELANKLWPCARKQIVVSIMAGVGIRRIANMLGTEQVVRTMPNLALKTGESLTAWLTKMADSDLEVVYEILDAWGDNMRLDDEQKFNAFTATAGSGPGYIFEFAAGLEQAAINQGFTAEQASKISLQTLRGTASLPKNGDSLKSWVGRVASRGGTTQAALNVFRERQQEKMINDAVEAAKQRSIELGK
jgi:pyrroline-5-carboxylate reductase